MPMVINKSGTTEFPYTAKGVKDAQALAQKTGGRVVHHQDDPRKELKNENEST